MISSEIQSVDLFRRSAQGTWEFVAYGAGEQLELKSLGLSVAIAEIYEDAGLAMLNEPPIAPAPDRPDSELPDSSGENGQQV